MYLANAKTTTNRESRQTEQTKSTKIATTTHNKWGNREHTSNPQAYQNSAVLPTTKRLPKI